MEFKIDTMPTAEYPYSKEKVPVVSGLEGFLALTEQFPDFTFCPYVAEKDDGGWARSTSRVYMNQVLPNFLYVPVNIAKDDRQSLGTFFAHVAGRSDIPAVNITQPHKSSPVLRELYFGDAQSPGNVDTLIRNEAGKLEPYDLNSTAFVDWFKADIGPFIDQAVVLVGVGGVGEPIAKKIAAEQPKSIHLVDIVDRAELAKQLAASSGIEVTFSAVIDDGMPSAQLSDTILINAAGKEGATNESELWRVLGDGTANGIFVDIRPHLDIDVVKHAKVNGWQARTGHGMNARNDYVLLQGIAKHLRSAPIPSFDAFQSLVAQAS